MRGTGIEEKKWRERQGGGGGITRERYEGRYNEGEV